MSTLRFVSASSACATAFPTVSYAFTTASIVPRSTATDAVNGTARAGLRHCVRG